MMNNKQVSIKIPRNCVNELRLRANTRNPQIWMKNMFLIQHFHFPFIIFIFLLFLFSYTTPIFYISDRSLFPPFFPLLSCFFVPSSLKKVRRQRRLSYYTRTSAVWWFLGGTPLCHYQRPSCLQFFLPPFHFFIFSIVLQQRSRSRMVPDHRGTSEMVSSIMGNSLE